MRIFLRTDPADTDMETVKEAAEEKVKETEMVKEKEKEKEKVKETADNVPWRADREAALL